MNSSNKNILVLSHVYPGAGVPDTFTPVVHYFVKEWIKMGYNVKVVSIWNYFPWFYYLAPNWFRRLVVKKFGCALPEKQLSKDIAYQLEGVKVFRYTLKKWFPASSYSVSKLDMLSCKIIKTLQKEHFLPNFIISHWSCPQIYISNILKKEYGAKAALVLHENGLRIKEFDNWKELVNGIDVWGYRSLSIKNDFENYFGPHNRSFRCCSGIPKSYINDTLKRNWHLRNRYVYVGYLLKRKFADVAINAVADSYGKSSYQFDVIGNGEMFEDLENLINKRNLCGNVHLRGRLKREEILNYLDASDVFIMISKDEVFGLVYLEAMARGCITIASKNEGMEGIIIDGYNGFLCEAGNHAELCKIIKIINDLPIEKINEISQNAISTARQYTDEAVAAQYIYNVENL